MHSVFHVLPFITTYIHVLIDSSSEKQHKEYLQTVFNSLLMLDLLCVEENVKSKCHKKAT